MRHRELEIGHPTFNEKKLNKAMSLLNIPSSLLIGNYKVNHRAINLTTVNDSNYVVSFNGKSGILYIPLYQ